MPIVYYRFRSERRVRTLTFADDQCGGIGEISCDDLLPLVFKHANLNYRKNMLELYFDDNVEKGISSGDVIPFNSTVVAKRMPAPEPVKRRNY